MAVTPPAHPSPLPPPRNCPATDILPTPGDTTEEALVAAIALADAVIALPAADTLWLQANEVRSHVIDAMKEQKGLSRTGIWGLIFIVVAALLIGLGIGSTL